MTAFDRAWDITKRGPENPNQPGWIGGGVMEGRLGVPEEDPGTKDKLGPPTDMGGDACCIDAKNKWIEGLREGMPSDEHFDRRSESQKVAPTFYEGIYNKYEEMTCDEFRLSLEQFAGQQPGHKGFTDSWENTLAQRILGEWDECIANEGGGAMGDVNDWDMWLSEPREVKSSFDTAWDVTKNDIQMTMDEFNENKNKLARLSVDDGVLNTVEAFSGASSNPDLEAGWSQGFDERGHNVQRIELEQDKRGRHIPGMFGYKPDFNDILDVHAEDLIEGANGEPIHVFTASYPCEDFSLLGGGKKWTDWDTEKKRKFNIARALQDADFFKDPRVGPTPVEEEQGSGLKLLDHTLQVRDDLRRDNPDLIWLLENPNNSLSRYQPQLGMEPLIQPRPIGMTSKYRMPQIEGVKPVRIARKPHEAPPPSVTHASYASRLSALLGGSGKPMPGHVLDDTIPGHTLGLPPRKPTDLWSNLAHGLGGFEARPLTTPNVNPDFPEEAYEEPTRYYPEGSRGVPGKGRVWPPKRFGHAGLYHAVGERGGGGIQRQGAWTSPKGITIPPYWMRSLIPAELGRDVADAAEKWYGAEDYSTKGRR